jgi:hypothetical protein
MDCIGYCASGIDDDMKNLNESIAEYWHETVSSIATLTELVEFGKQVYRLDRRELFKSGFRKTTE